MGLVNLESGCWSAIFLVLKRAKRVWKQKTAAFGYERVNEYTCGSGKNLEQDVTPGWKHELWAP